VFGTNAGCKPRIFYLLNEKSLQIFGLRKIMIGGKDSLMDLKTTLKVKK